MPRLYPFIILVVVLFGCSAKKDQVESSDIQQSYTGDPATGKLLYATCVPCHGDAGQGNRKMNAPALANLDSWYLNHQLLNFSKGIRGDSQTDTLGFQMAAMAKTLKDSVAVADVVAYINTLPDATLIASLSGDIKKGERTYQSVCGSCHGSGAKGNELMNAPRLSGTDDWYLKRQLVNFKNSVRGAHPDDKLGAQMVPMSALLADEEAVNNVIAYIVSHTSQAK
ncbi:MAG TPA: c-type cytochrome [Ohtaekwangia sp.]